MRRIRDIGVQANGYRWTAPKQTVHTEKLALNIGCM